MGKVSQAELVAGAIAREAVSFPTDTVPALAIKPEYGQRIYQLKQRATHKPLILMGASITDLLPFVTYTPDQFKVWQKLIKKYWPGALTLVLPASKLVPAVINSNNTNTVGIRVPNHPLALQILGQTGVLATTSANISGTEALTNTDDIAQTFPDVLVLETNNLEEKNGKNNLSSGLPSTVVGWQDDRWQVFRQGSIAIESISNTNYDLC